MEMCKGGREPKQASYNYRVEYMEAGHIKVAIVQSQNIDTLKELYRSVHKNRKILAICLVSDYEKLYEKYSDIMNPVKYER